MKRFEPSRALARQRRSRVDWDAVIGNDGNDTAALRQISWERYQTVMAMRRAGMTWTAIANRFDVSRARIAQMERYARRYAKWGWRSPAEAYLAPWTPRLLLMETSRQDLLKLAASLEPFTCLRTLADAPKRDWLLVASRAAP